jgi:hypothetical protein
VTVPVFPPPLEQAPASLVSGGTFAFGSYDGLIADVDIGRAWSRPTRAWHQVRTKEWQAFQVSGEDVFVLGAVYDAKILGLLQVVVVETSTGRTWRYEHKVPSPVLHVATGLSGTRSHGRWHDLSLMIRNGAEVGSVTVAARSSRPSAPLRLNLRGDLSHEAAGHLTICHAFADGMPLYSAKSSMPVAGSILTGDRRFDLDPATSVLLVDDHKGHYPLPMAYDWVTGARATAGRRLSFNLTRNQVPDPDTYNENVLVLNGRVHRLPAVRFHRPNGPHGPWHIRDEAGAVEVMFHPKVRNEQHVGPGKVLAEYYGPFGSFTGEITTQSGRRVAIDGVYGMGEQKRIRL